jgi:hypothetical protein
MPEPISHRAGLRSAAWRLGQHLKTIGVGIMCGLLSFDDGFD